MTDKTERDALVALGKRVRDEAEATALSSTCLRLGAIAIEIEALAAPAEGDGAVARAWAEGYASGVTDERTSEANIGIAGFGAKIEPARENPYTRPAATAVVPRPSDDELWDQTLRERDDAEEALGDMFQAVTGRPAEWSSAWHYKDAIEEVEDHMAMLAAAPAAPKGGVVDEACQWTYDDSSNAWDSSCGRLWSFVDGGLEDNRVSFCHGCGKPIAALANQEQP